MSFLQSKQFDKLADDDISTSYREILILRRFLKNLSGYDKKN